MAQGSHGTGMSRHRDVTAQGSHGTGMLMGQGSHSTGMLTTERCSWHKDLMAQGSHSTGISWHRNAHDRGMLMAQGCSEPAEPFGIPQLPSPKPPAQPIPSPPQDLLAQHGSACPHPTAEGAATSRETQERESPLQRRAEPAASPSHPRLLLGGQPRCNFGFPRLPAKGLSRIPAVPAALLKSCFSTPAAPPSLFSFSGC